MTHFPETVMGRSRVPKRVHIVRPFRSSDIIVNRDCFREDTRASKIQTPKNVH